MTEPREFTVAGPFHVPTRGPARGRSLDRPACKALWDADLQAVAADTGCYVFALRRGQGYLPVYVGKTDRSFEAECFTDRNYRLLHEALADQHGTLVVFLVAYERGRGRYNAAPVRDLEKYLIESALLKNPKLANRHWVRSTVSFAVRGIHRAPGRPSRSAVALKRTLGLGR